MKQHTQILRAQEAQVHAQARREARKNFIAGIAAGAALVGLAVKAFGSA